MYGQNATLLHGLKSSPIRVVKFRFNGLHRQYFRLFCIQVVNPNQTIFIMTKTVLIGAAVITALALLAFNPEKSHGRLPKEIRKEYVYVPNGSISKPDGSIEVSAFFMKSAEITIAEYREFIRDLQKSGDLETLQVALPDSTAWRMQSTHLEPLERYYFNHPAYDEYPVVCVSYEGAKAWCDWKTKKALTEKTKDGYTAYYRLPTKEEWIYAAHNNHPQSIYSWGGSDIKNLKGCFLCNFNPTAEDADGDPLFPSGLADNAQLTAPVKSYAPSTWGFYNQNGNVAEMVSESGIAMGGSWNSSKTEITNTSEMAFTSPNPMVGFRPVIVYMKSTTN